MGTTEEAVSPTHWIYPDGEVGVGRWERSSAISFASQEPVGVKEIRVWSINDILISGNAATGKSTLIETLLLNVLQNANPDEVRIILFDDANVGFARFQGLPHLLTPPISQMTRLLTALSWMNNEINSRYELLVECGMKTWSDMKAHAGTVEGNEFPQIIFFLDDIPLNGAEQLSEVWSALELILSRGSKVGVLLVVAASLGTVKTMPPSVRQVFETKISLRTSNSGDSQLITGVKGAELLSAPGQALLLQAADGGAHVFQFDDIDQQLERKVIQHWKNQVPVQPGIEPSYLVPATKTDEDDLLRRAKEIVVRSGLGSTSLLQRKLAVGFARAGRLMDELENLGIVGPAEGAHFREVLMSPDELDS